MGPAVKEEKTIPKGGSKCFKLSVVFLLLNVTQVTGFFLRSCHISYSNAICDNSKLVAVPQDIPSTLKGFDLSSNKITKIQASDFKNLRVLTKLDLKQNRIAQIDRGAFADLISLNKLNLNRNKLVKLGDFFFDGLSNLTELRINSNHIKALASTSFKSLTSLTFLDISCNKLHHVHVHSLLQHLPNLRTLSIKSNKLTTFRSWELTNSSLELVSLDLSKNPIAVFQITEDIFPNLSWISIGGESEKMIWDVRNKTFLSRVSTLDISELRLASDNMKTVLESFNSSLTSLRLETMKHNLTALINISCTIPTVSKLQIRENKLRFVRSDLFQLCINITELNLADNTILNIQDGAFRSLQGLTILSLNQNHLSSVPGATTNLSTLVELDLSNNNISSLRCHDFANLTKLRHLSLYLNSISVLKECFFKDLIKLQVLKLQTNRISKLNGAFKTYLPKLRQLRLSGNKLTAIKQGDFKGLKSLQNLTLHENQISVLENGSFIGLTSLTDIQLRSNNIEKSQINTGCFNDLINLRRLDLGDNHIRYEISSALPDPPFSKLSFLETLAITGQHHRGKSQLPCNFLQGLTNLLFFYARNMQLLSLPKHIFKYTPRLQLLDISSNDLVDLSPDLFAPIQGLKSLYISRTSLRSLDSLTDANLTKLEFLQARKNAFSIISEEVFSSLPALIYVDLQGNSFTCDCDNAWFLQWAENNNQTQVFDADNFECNYPLILKGMKLLDLNIRSCSVDIDFICFISTTCVTVVFLLVSFTYHFLRWQLVYAYYLFLAFLFKSKHKNKKGPKQYDAFISYNTHDEPWVIRKLLPKLEGEQGWKLCLHHRDFEPGKPIIDNITDAIYGSRKTICVISRRYLESEWCSKEIQVASFRLFDEQMDVLILLFLEEIPTYQLSPHYRMRKLLKRQTYLSWQQAGRHNELFWEKLRQALSTADDVDEGMFHLSPVNRP